MLPCCQHSKVRTGNDCVTDILECLQHIDGINLFGLISIASLLYCAPLAILMEGGKWSGAYNGALADIGKQELVKQMAVAGIFYHLYNQVSPASVMSVHYTYTCVCLDSSSLFTCIGS